MFIYYNILLKMFILFIKQNKTQFIKKIKEKKDIKKK